MRKKDTIIITLLVLISVANKVPLILSLTLKNTFYK